MPTAVILRGGEETTDYVINWHTSVEILYSGSNAYDLYNAGDGYVLDFTIPGTRDVHAFKFTGTADTDMRGVYMTSTPHTATDPDYGLKLWSTGTITPPSTICSVYLGETFVLYDPAAGHCASTDYDSWSGVDRSSFTLEYSRWGDILSPSSPSNSVVWLGNVVTAPPFDGDKYSHRRKITVNKEAVTGTPTNVQVMVDLTGSTLDAELMNSLLLYQQGALLSVKTTDGDECSCDVGAMIKDNGAYAIRLYFLAPTLSSSADTDFYLDYGDRNDNTPINPVEVWNQTRAGVWHFGCEVMGQFSGGQ